MLLVSPTQGRDEAAIGVNGTGALSEQKPLLPGSGWSTPNWAAMLHPLY